MTDPLFIKALAQSEFLNTDTVNAIATEWDTMKTTLRTQLQEEVASELVDLATECQTLTEWKQAVIVGLKEAGIDVSTTPTASVQQVICESYVPSTGSVKGSDLTQYIAELDAYVSTRLSAEVAEFLSEEKKAGPMVGDSTDEPEDAEGSDTDWKDEDGEQPPATDTEKGEAVASDIGAKMASDLGMSPEVHEYLSAITNNQKVKEVIALKRQVDMLTKQLIVERSLNSMLTSHVADLEAGGVSRSEEDTDVSDEPTPASKTITESIQQNTVRSALSALLTVGNLK